MKRRLEGDLCLALSLSVVLSFLRQMAIDIAETFKLETKISRRYSRKRDNCTDSRNCWATSLRNIHRACPDDPRCIVTLRILIGRRVRVFLKACRRRISSSPSCCYLCTHTPSLALYSAVA